MLLLNIETIAEELRHVKLADVSKETGLVYNTLKNIREGRGANYSTIVKLSEYFGRK